MTLDTAIVLAAIVLAVLWPTHQQLTIRALRHSLRRQRAQLAQHRRAIVQLQGAATQPPTSVGQPMPTVGRPQPNVTIGGVDMSRYVKSLDVQADPDRTLRLARPPALSDVEHVLTQAGRALTATEMATQLGRKPWDLLPDIVGAVKAGRIRTVPGHTAGRTAYELADTDTLRLPRGMSVLPGVSR